GMSGTWEVHLGERRLDRPRIHPLLPVGVVAVCDLEGDRATQRPAVADPPGDLDLVALDLHPPTPAVPELAACQVAIDRVAVQGQPRRQPLEDARQAGAMGLPG